MPCLEEQDVEFARRHITRFYDTDFFPRHFGLEVIWHNWNEVKAQLLSKEIQQIPLPPPLSIPWPKPRGGYRIVHQPDPLSSVVYAALAHSVAAAIENAREPQETLIACSYRIHVADGSFFDSGTGYSAFRERTADLCAQCTHVLTTDITDFYNQIYVHRVRNAIYTADPRLEAQGIALEKLFMRWNQKTSQGIPVGPPASIIMSEAVLIDVDRFVRDRGFSHTRYVDDFRIFGNSARELRNLLRELTAYIYEVHRLNLSAEKTKLYTTDEFLKENLQNAYELEKIDIFEGVTKVINPYTNEEEELFSEDFGHEEAIDALTKLLDRLLALPNLDLGLARSVIRKARGLGLAELAETLLDNIDRLLPVANDIFIYFSEVGLSYPDEGFIKKLSHITTTQVADEPAFRIWMEWFVSTSTKLIQVAPLKAYVMSGSNHIAQARIAISEKSTNWAREKKQRYWELGASERLAAIYASTLLAKDERNPWLQTILAAGSGATTMEKWFAETCLAEAFDLSDFDELLL